MNKKSFNKKIKEKNKKAGAAQTPAYKKEKPVT